MTRIILASGSPRRRELLAKLYDKFEIITSEVDETLDASTEPVRGVQILAVRKGEAVADTLDSDCVVISSDTLVEIDGQPLGKPTSREDAYRMLRLLSGNYHNVHTGIAVHYAGRVVSDVASARVKFKPLTDAEIYAYIDGGECDRLYNEMSQAYERLRDRLGVVDEDTDVEIIINNLLRIQYILCEKMFRCGQSL